ncbi:MAG: OmpH family outer membrane protein [Cytophagaceae bacterium]
MYSKKILLPLLALVLAIGLSAFFLKPSTGNDEAPSKKLGYLYNQKVFDGYVKTREARKALLAYEDRHKGRLDSLDAIIKSGLINGKQLSAKEQSKLMEVREEESREFDESRSNLSQELNEQIWYEINKAVEKFGKENGYGFIYGANGNGSLMYAEEGLDLTSKILEYLNKSNESL